MGNFVTGLFYGPAKFSATTPKLEMDMIIRAKEAYLGAVNWFHALLWYLSISMTLVPGYALGGPVVTFSALPHAIWCIPGIAISNYISDSRKANSQSDINDMSVKLTTAFWFMILVIAINITQLVATGLEIGQGTSTFVLQNSGAWAWVLLIGLIVIILLEAWIMWRIHVSVHDKLEGYKYGWRPGMIVPVSEEDAESMETGGGSPQVPPKENITLDPETQGPAPPPPSTPSDMASNLSNGRVVAHLPVNMFYRVGSMLGNNDKKMQ